MNFQGNSFKPDYNISIMGFVVYISTLAIALMLILVRNSNSMWDLIPFLEKYPFNLHISNLCLSYMLMLTQLFTLLRKGSHKVVIFSFGTIIIVANLIYEFAIPILNTQDPKDAVAGIVGVILGYIMLLLIQRFCLVQVKTKPIIKH